MGERPKQRQTILVYARRMSLASLADLPTELLHPRVRDLAWTLVSPPLLCSTPWVQRHPLTASRWSANPGQLADWLLRQDADPSPLEAWLAQSSIRRLGLYYERLWQFALCQAPDVELLRANLPVRQAGHTLGEMDLLLRDEQGVHHLELAVKFYLGLEDGDRSRHDQWLGPGSHDRLDLKLTRLCQHQLPLSAGPQARALLDELTLSQVSSALWLGGYLFEPWPNGCESPAGANPQHLRGRWLRQAQWAGFRAAQPGSRWQPLPRHAWLAPACVSAAQLWNDAQLDAWLIELQPFGQAHLLVRMEASAHGWWAERERIFLVPNNWPD